MVKIDGSLFEFAMKNIECAPERVVHIGDSQERDIIGAKQAGLKAVWLNLTKEQPLTGKPQADRQISAIEELLDLL
jgi:putative hydrolase of the HAD superfamily